MKGGTFRLQKAARMVTFLEPLEGEHTQLPQDPPVEGVESGQVLPLHPVEEDSEAQHELVGILVALVLK